MNTQSLLYRDYAKRQIKALIAKTGIQVKGWEEVEDEGELYEILLKLERKESEQLDLFKEAV